jgi:SAM-dependent methyltransferase
VSAGSSTASGARRPRTQVLLPLAWALRRGREFVDPVLVHGVHPERPVPSRRLRARTGAPGIREFLSGGRRAAEELAASVGGAFGGVESVLDLGCGSARVLPHVAEMITGARCAGCDVDAAAIAWAAQHYPRFDWALSGPEPPLPFADGSFELVYSISVFSHLGEPSQDRWLQEIARVLVPGGRALLSVHGCHAFEQFRSGEASTVWCPPDAFARNGLGPEEFVFEPYIRSVWNEAELPGVAESYGLAFHGEQYLHSHWSRWLQVEAVRERALTGWQDLVLCRAPGQPLVTTGRRRRQPSAS